MPKLHLSDEDLALLEIILDSYDWLCNCEDWPNCEDFKRYKRLCERVSTLSIRAWQAKKTGWKGYAKMRENLRRELADSIFAVFKEMKKNGERKTWI